MDRSSLYNRKKEELTAYVSNNCQGITDRTDLDKVKPLEAWARQRVCSMRVEELQQGGDLMPYPSTPKYLAINAAVAAVGFVVIYGLTFLLPALARRYWRWLNT